MSISWVSIVEIIFSVFLVDFNPCESCDNIFKVWLSSFPIALLLNPFYIFGFDLFWQKGRIVVHNNLRYNKGISFLNISILDI